MFATLSDLSRQLVKAIHREKCFEFVANTLQGNDFEVRRYHVVAKVLQGIEPEIYTLEGPQVVELKRPALIAMLLGL